MKILHLLAFFSGFILIATSAFLALGAGFESSLSECACWSDTYTQYCQPRSAPARGFFYACSEILGHQLSSHCKPHNIL